MLTLPIMLVGAIAAGALFPHLAPPPSNSTGPAGSPPARSASPIAGAEPDLEHTTTALDLLADYFGVDTTPKNLKKLLRKAAADLGRVDDQPLSDSLPPAALLRAFFCMDDIRGLGARRLTYLDYIWAMSVESNVPPPPDCDKPNDGRPTLSDQELRRFVDDYVNEDARRDEVIVSRAIGLDSRGADAAGRLVVDEQKLRAKDFDRVNKEPLAWTVVRHAALKHASTVQFLIATVPDPIDSYETWQFDPHVDAIRQGIEASKYLLDRFYLPDAQPDRKSEVGSSAAHRRHEEAPGVILFREKNDSRKLLVLFLVPETPVNGIHQEAFIRAVDFTTGWMSRDSEPLAGSDVKILGPTFSGSVPSLVRAFVNTTKHLRRLEGRPQPATISMITGSASNDSNRRKLEDASESAKIRIQFRSTMHSNPAIAAGLNQFLSDQWILEEPRRGYLSEATTAYGSELAAADPDRAPPVTIRYPLYVSRLRSDASRGSVSRRDSAIALLPSLRPLSFEDVVVPTDQLPLQTPPTSASAAELVLASQLEALRREKVRLVTVDATDVRDKLFLMKELRYHAPNVFLTTNDTDLFHVHPDQSEWLNGIVVASTYPLDSGTQSLVYPFGASNTPRPNGALVQFPSVNTQGVYNAAIALLNYRIDGTPISAGQDLPRLIDYSGVGSRCWHPENESWTSEPGVWISVVANRKVLPLKVYCNVERDLAKGDVNKDRHYVFRPMLPGNVDVPRSSNRVVVSSFTMLLTGFMVCLMATACCLAWWSSRKGIQELRETWAVALCGPVVASAFLMITLAPLAWLQLRAGEYAGPLVSASLAALSAGVVIFCVAAQRQARSFQVLRGSFMLVGLLSAVYAAGQLVPIPHFFLQRTFDIGAGFSPLLPIVAFAALPVLVASAESKRLFVIGRWLHHRAVMPVASRVGEPARAVAGVRVPLEGLPAAWDDRLTPTVIDSRLSPASEPAAAEAPLQSRRAWDQAFDSIGPLAAGKDDRIRDALVNCYKSLFHLPQRWSLLPAAATIVTGAMLFGATWNPVLTIEGPIFGWSLVVIVLLLQWVFAVSVTQFAHMSFATGAFLKRLGRRSPELFRREGGDGAAAASYPVRERPIGVIPRAPMLEELRSLDVGTAAELTEVQDELVATRWFQSRKWDAVRRELSLNRSHPLALSQDREQQRRIESVCVEFVVRELISRLSVSLLLVGPVLAILVILYTTVDFDRSHRLLGVIWTDVIVSVVIVMSVLIWIDRDEVFSRIRNTTPGAIDWNWDFISKVLLYVVLPLLTLFATQFPNLGVNLMRFLEPVQHLP